MAMWNDYEKIAKRFDRIANAFERIANALETANVIEADRKTEPQIEHGFSAKAMCSTKLFEDEPQTCDTCRYDKEPWYRQVCDECTVGDSNWKPKADYKKWDSPPKFEHKGINTNGVVIPACLLKNERCAECRHWSYGKDICNLHEMGMMADDYCSYWERK